MSALTWFEDFASEDGKGGIVSSLAALALDSAAMCEDIVSEKGPPQLWDDGYKVLRDASELLNEIHGADSVIGKILGRLLAFGEENGVRDNSGAATRMFKLSLTRFRVGPMASLQLPARVFEAPRTAV
jgi:hypothetical protein